MYDAKKDENVRDTKLRYNCIGDRGYYCMCKHNNMVNMQVSSVPVQIITKEFN
ncbi:MAG TPA: hypothetical protein VIM70_00890 [Clostridium sp.]|uniref:hypothetical protein n=1 Tax=Clostridium sp. TaxID=1506 RepID=UPI002F922F59